MEFRTRSLGCVLADLIRKLEQLPPEHPDRPALIRMIAGLQAETALRANFFPMASEREE